MDESSRASFLATTLTIRLARVLIQLETIDPNSKRVMFAPRPLLITQLTQLTCSPRNQLAALAANESTARRGICGIFSQQQRERGAQVGR